MILRSKKTFVLALLFGLALFLMACNPDPDAGESSSSSGGSEGEGNGDSKDGGDLIVGGLGGPTSFNSLYSTSSTDGAIQDFIFNGLIYLDENSEPQPDLATEWDVSDDGLIYTFKLRDDVTFHDGEPFTADDVVFTYSLPVHEDYNGPRGSSFETIDEIIAVDDHTVEIHLSDETPDIFARMVTYHILPEHILGDIPVEDVGKDDFNTATPIGTGPFTFDEWKQGQYVRVEANEDYFGDRPHIDSITYKIVPDKNSLMSQFSAGDLDQLSLSTEDIPSGQALVEEGKANLESTQSASYTFMLYNLEHPALKEKEVRQALAYGLDRDSIIDNVLDGNGKVMHHPGIDFLWAFNEDVPKYDRDIEKAKQLLEDAGWKVGSDGIREKDGERLSFSIISNQGNKVREKIMLIAKQQWEEELGVETSTEIIESSAYSDKVHRHEFDVAMRGWSISLDPGFTSYMHTRMIEDGANYGHYSNPELDALMDESDHEPDRDKRKELIEEQQEIVAEDQPYLFLYTADKYMLYNPKLQDVTIHPKDDFYLIHEWWFE